MYHGNFDRNYINGLKQCEEEFKKLESLDNDSITEDVEENETDKKKKNLSFRKSSSAVASVMP